MIRGLKPYPASKDSGVDWLGKVPVHWKTYRLKSRLIKNDSGIWNDLHDPAGTIILRSTEQTVSGGWRIENPARLLLTCVEREAYMLKVGDLVITKSSGSSDHIGKTSLVTEKVAALGCAFSNFMQRLRLDENTNPKLVWYYLNSPIGREQLVFQSTTTTGLGNLNAKIFGNCVIALPSLPEQTAIVRFLDWAEWRIRRVIRARKKRTKLLEEYKQALIHQAVTGQIDVRTGQPYPVYKCSGVEWFCEVPKHWEVCRLKAMLIKNDSGVWHNRHDPNGTIVLRSTEQTISGGWRIENPAWLDLSRIERETYMLRVGDLVITKSSGSPDHIGKTSLVTGEIAALGCAFSNFLQRLRLDKNSNPKFVWYYLNSILGREQLVFHSTTTTGLGNLNAKIIGNCVIAFPNLLEQNVIVEYLDNQTAKIDAAIDATHKEIELLREYLTRLISDVVTGKVDVREVAAQLPEEPAEEDEMNGDEIDEYEAEGGEADNETVETFFEEEGEP